jgi:(p)ppGpp synthase/HD superfamily hydrolase
VRKDGMPYIVHPVEVAMELARNGADEEVICAGYLHDTIEDAYITPEQLQKAFTPKVASLVFMDSEDKSKSWEERKKAALKDLETSGNRDYQMLMCADKLANLRSVRDGLSEVGEDAWKRFKRGKESQAWLFREMVRALSALEGLPMYEELKRLTAEIFGDI